MKKMTTEEAGKMGSDVRWAERYAILKELSKHYPKAQIIKFAEKWSTEQLKEIYKLWIQK
jgi:hypothetical protein